MRWLLPLVVLLQLQVARAATQDVLVIATDDTALSQALARASAQQFTGPVALAPAGWSGPVKPGTLRLQVVHRRTDWLVVLSGPDASVSRELAIQSELPLDLAEAVALALPGLETKLSTRRKALLETRRAHEVETAPPPPVVAPPPEPPRTDVPPPEPARPEEKPSRVVQSAAAPILEDTHESPPVEPDSSGAPYVGVSLSLGSLVARHLVAGGADVAVEPRFFGPWMARFSVGSYVTSFHEMNLWLVPIDAVFGARLSHGPFSAELLVGGELTVATTGMDTGANTSLVLHGSAGWRFTDHWTTGVRLAAAYTTDAADVDDSEGRELYMPQLQFRAGLFVRRDFQ